MKNFVLRTPAVSTQIHIGRNFLADAPLLLAHAEGARRVAVVTDSYLAKQYAERFTADLKKFCDARVFVVPRGEAAKRLEVAERLCAALLKSRFGRDGWLVAFGGGSVGDLTGFVASIYMRGIPYAQIPTTLVAQVDSSIGGKTGVNLPRGKNIVGAFWQPRAVFIDPVLLRTLPARQLNAGMAEVVKTAMVGDAGLFRYIERNAAAIKRRDAAPLERIIFACARFKARLVEADERESGPRMLLNFGHTFGHAVEAATNYKKHLHGEAVAMGMAAATRIAEAKGLCANSVRRRLEVLLKRFSLPTEIPAAVAPRLTSLVAGDKKARGGRLTLVFPRKIGEAEIVGGFDVRDIRKMLKETICQ